MKQNGIRLIFLFALMIVTVLSLFPVERLPSGLDWWDKAQHVVAFFFLGMLGLATVKRQTSRIGIIFFLLMYGAAIELLQMISGWRFGDWADELANAIGLCLSWFIYSAMIKFLDQSGLLGSKD